MRSSAYTVMVWRALVVPPGLRTCVTLAALITDGRLVVHVRLNWCRSAGGDLVERVDH